MFAAFNGHSQVVEILIASGADVNSMNNVRKSVPVYIIIKFYLAAKVLRS